MEKIIQINNIEQIEALSYFSCEVLCVIGVIVNLFMFMFFSRKYNIKRISDLTTFGVFALNSLISFGIFLKNKITFGEFSFALLNQNLVFDNNAIFFEFLSYVFFACFVLCTYKLTRRANFMGSIMNSSLLLLALASSLLIKAQNGILAFLLLDFVSLFIYKFASNMRIRKYEAYSLDFVFMSATSTILFYSFYLLSFLIKEELQLAIMQVCMVCALLLKAGLFPVYNYLLNRHTKNNLAYSMLLFGFLPYMGVMSFVKFTQNINVSNEIFFITLCVFVLIVMITNVINLAKTKNLVKFVANLAYLNTSFCIMAILFMQDVKDCMNFLFASMFAIFALYSLLAILKINLKSEKLNISLLQNLFIKNRLFCVLFSLVILFASCVLPSILSNSSFELLSGIYTFDKIGSWVALVCIFSAITVILKSVKIIKTLYTKKNIFKKGIKLTKRTTPNYVVPIVIIFLLVVLMFL